MTEERDAIRNESDDAVRNENEVEAHSLRKGQEDDSVRASVRNSARKENDEPDVEGHGVRNSVKK